MSLLPPAVNIIAGSEAFAPDANGIIGRAETPFGPAAFLSEQDRLVALKFLAPLEETPEPEAMQCLCARWSQWQGSNISCRRDDDRASDWSGRIFADAAPEPVNIVLYGTAFRRQVWRALLSIPCGQTCSYGELAAQIGCPGGARAIGGAVGSNPLSWLLPCHRVIGANGALTGYGGGLARKRAMLAAEQACQPGMAYSESMERTCAERSSNNAA